MPTDYVVVLMSFVVIYGLAMWSLAAGTHLINEGDMGSTLLRPTSQNFHQFLLASLLVMVARLYLNRRASAVMIVVLVIADLFAFGINYNPTCERSKVYPETKLTTELKRLTRNGERIAPINPSWSLFQIPREAILPPNAAMVYGLYDVQGYDSLYTKAYQSLMAQVEGIDPSPPENGNMVLLRRLPREQWMVSTAAYYLSNRPLNTGKLRQVRRVNDVFILSTGYQGDRPFAVTYDGNPSGNVIYGRFRTANRADIPIPKGCFDVSRDMACSMPGWFGVSKDQVASPSVLREGTGSLLLSHNPVRLDRPEWLIAYGPTTVMLSYEPFTFRLGLFLMLVGVGALSCVGVHRAIRYRITA